jgi:hypothetical protein
MCVAPRMSLSQPPHLPLGLRPETDQAHRSQQAVLAEDVHRSPSAAISHRLRSHSPHSCRRTPEKPIRKRRLRERPIRKRRLRESLAHGPPGAVPRQKPIVAVKHRADRCNPARSTTRPEYSPRRTGRCKALAARKILCSRCRRRRRAKHDIPRALAKAPRPPRGGGGMAEFKRRASTNKLSLPDLIATKEGPHPPNNMTPELRSNPRAHESATKPERARGLRRSAQTQKNTESRSQTPTTIKAVHCIIHI